MLDEKAQLHTLEGIAAATLLLTVIIYAIDATSMTPLTSSTSNAHVETELATLGQDILNTLDYADPGYDSKLKNDIKRWNGKVYIWNGTAYMEKDNASFPQNKLSNNDLAEILKAVLVRQAIAHNVELKYLVLIDNITMPASSYLIYGGDPSDNAVIVSRRIVLHDGDINDTNNPIEDIDPATNLYNIVDVKLILWRM